MENSPLLYIPKHTVSQPAQLPPPSYARKAGWLILAMTLLKGIAAFVLQLGNDESYYWFYSLDLKWNYFDHPPLVALWTRLFTLGLWLQDHPGWLRLGSLLGSAAATWFIFRATATLHSGKAGFYAAILYNASFYAGITAGLFLMPDAPQMVFWTFSLWMLARLVRNENDRTAWLLFGVTAGLCIMSKVHGVFLYFGLGLFILWQRRHWLARPQLYMAAAVTLLIASPILIWNLQYNFASYRFHSGRVAVDETVEGLSFVKEVLQQFLFNNPFNVVLVFAALVHGFRQKIKVAPALSLFHCIAWPLAGALLFVSLFRDATLPHWSGPAYVTLIPLAAIHLTQLKKPNAWLRWSLGTFITTLLAYTLLVQFYPGTLGQQTGMAQGKGDNSLDVYGWEEAGAAFEPFYKAEVQQGLMPAGAPVVCAKWWGAHVEYYFCRPLQLPMFGLGPLYLLHEYLWMNGKRKEGTDLSKAYCIVPSDEYYDVQKAYDPYYSRIELVKTIETWRGGKPARRFYIYRLSGWKGRLPVVP